MDTVIDGRADKSDCPQRALLSEQRRRTKLGRQASNGVLGTHTRPTPPFPEYSSGHSNFSAAGAEILKRATHSDRFGAFVTLPAGSSWVEPGAVPASDITLSWLTFADAAEQAGISRRYGGIHFEQGDLDARSTGRSAARRAWDKASDYWEGG